MNVAICYVFPNLKLSTYEPMARRFAQSYQEFPPGNYPHSLNVIVNGYELNERQRSLFSPLPVNFLNHNNYAKDIGAFMVAATSVPCDLMVCLGSPIHFQMGGWLDRIVDIYSSAGPGLYGCWGFKSPNPHIRTTAFWLPPDLLSSYPYKIDNDRRYTFEHGAKESIMQWTIQNGLPVAMVTWTRVGIYPDFVHVPKNDCLLLDQHQDKL